MRLFVSAVVFWIIAAVLVTLVVSHSPAEEVTIDLSDLNAGQIIVGTNRLFQPDFDCPYQLFVERSFRFDIVLVGYSQSPSLLIYLGREWTWEGKEQWYRAEQKLRPPGWFLVTQGVRITEHGQTLTIFYHQSRALVGLAVFGVLLFFGGIGGAIFSYARKSGDA